MQQHVRLLFNKVQVNAFIANNQNVINNLASGALNRANQMIGGSSSLPSDSMSPQMTQQQAPISQNQIPLPQNNAVNASPIASLTPQQQSILQQQAANQVKANMGGVSPYMTKKLDNTIAIEKFTQSPSIQMLAQSAKDYAGIKGKGQQFIDKWMGNNSVHFENNLEFKNSFTSDLVNLQRNLEALSIQPSQRKELITNIRGAFDEWSSNPDRAIDQFNRAIAQLKDIAGGTSLAAQPFYPGVREKLAGLEAPSTNNLANYIQGKKQEEAQGMAIQNTRPGYVYVDNGKGQRGYISNDEWKGYSDAERSQYKEIK